MLDIIPVSLEKFGLFVFSREAGRIIFLAKVVLTTDSRVTSLELLLYWKFVAIFKTIFLTARSVVLLVVDFSLFSCQQVLDAIYNRSYLLVPLLRRLLHDPRTGVTHRLYYHIIEMVLALTKHLHISLASDLLLLGVLNLGWHLLLLLGKGGLIRVCMHHGGILYLLHLNLKSLGLVKVVALDSDLLLGVQVLKLNAHRLKPVDLHLEMLSELEVLIGDRQLFVNFKLSDLILSIRVEKSHVIIRRCTKLGAVALWGLIHLLSRI